MQDQASVLVLADHPLLGALLGLCRARRAQSSARQSPAQRRIEALVRSSFPRSVLCLPA
jgi:hypothetical protein